MDATKVCSTCHEVRPRSEFNKWARAKDGLQARCRACCRHWYLEHREEHLANVAERSRVYRAEYHRRIVEYLEAHPCADCGEGDVVVLEFDHREPDSKVTEVAKLVNMLASWARIEAEIAKCDVCCANCHRRRTAERGGQRKHVHQQQRQAEQAQASQDRLRRLFPVA